MEQKTAALENHSVVTKRSSRVDNKLSIIIDNLIPARRDMSISADQDVAASRQEARRAVMAVLAHAEPSDIAGRLEAIALPAYEMLREAESGLVMVRGRIGGDGAPFNLGEATVSRAAVRLSTGEVGLGYTLGRDGKKARLIALCDAMVQSDQFVDVIEAEVIAPLRAVITAKQAREAAETAATRVDFYTLVRGEG
jgi:alpha-D-ribose 1-methylphosphonate 5-triphosphate synthase subunit PhnG